MKQTDGLNVWGLQSPKEFALYVRNAQDVKKIISGKQISVSSPIYGVGYWYDVHTGDIIDHADLALGQQTLSVPTFQTDIAFIANNAATNSPIADTLFRIDVNPRTEVLLNIPIKTKQTFSIDITNTGSKPVFIERAWTSSPSKILTLTPQTAFFPFVLNPYQKVTLPVEYTMSDTGGTGAMLSIEHSGSPSWENVAISATGIQSSSVRVNPKEEIRISPDPANDEVNVEWLLPQQEKISVQLFTVEGIKILEKALLSGKAKFDVSKLSPGTYQVVLKAGDTILTTKKVIIMH
jgi:hypothetical protein